MMWLERWRPEGAAESEALRPMLERLGARGVYGALLFLITWQALTHVPYFPGVWQGFLPVLVFVTALLSLPAAVFVGTFLVFWGLLYSSPAYALWFALFMLILAGIYEDRLEQVILLAATPVLLFYKLAFLPVLVVGVMFRARGGLANGLGCVAAIAVGAALGAQSLGDAVVTGLGSEQGPVVYPRLDLPKGLLDVAWVGGLTWEAFAGDLARLAVRWAETFTRSPVALAQVILWGFAAIVAYQLTVVVRLALGWLGGKEWLRTLFAHGLGILGAGLLLMVASPWVLSLDTSLGDAVLRYVGAVREQVLWSGAAALAAVVAVDMLHLARWREFRWRIVVPDPRAIWQRRAATPKPEAEPRPPE